MPILESWKTAVLPAAAAAAADHDPYNYSQYCCEYCCGCCLDPPDAGVLADAVTFHNDGSMSWSDDDDTAKKMKQKRSLCHQWNYSFAGE